MKKRLFCLVLSICLLASSGAFALGYTGRQGNAATFEFLEEARANGPAAIQNLEQNVGKVFASHPCLDGYPEGSAYVYRSADLFGGRAAARLNTNILVFAETSFASKDDALAYLNELGLIEIIDEAVGSVVLVTPSDPEVGFTAADQKYYYALQTALLAQKDSKTVGEETTYYSDAEYFGGYGYLYVVGIDGGATFLNNYVSSTFDYVSRIAGLLLIGGEMDRVREIATYVPTYLVNAEERVIARYLAANDVDAYAKEGEIEIHYNQQFPLRKVILRSEENADLKQCVRDAYYDMFIQAMRVPVVAQGLYTASTPFQGYNFDEAPYSLCNRNAVINGKTEDGIHVILHQEDRFSDIHTENGEYLETWFEYLPEEVLNHTAPEKSVPLVLANHGGSDDPRLYVDEIGLLDLCGSERFAMVAPEHQFITDIQCEALPALVSYMLETYPSLDPTRVYVTGYSMGGKATLMAISGNAGMFAAACPQASVGYEATEEQIKQYASIDMPILFTTSTFDMFMAFTPEKECLSDVGFRQPKGYQQFFNDYLSFMDLPQVEYDFEKYDFVGFEADRYYRVKLNGEYDSHFWFFDKEGVPMVGMNVTEKLIHALYPEYGRIAWDFMKHYSRNLETGAVEYNPYVE